MSFQEIGFLLDFFIQGGYVLNFTNNSFATFTMRSVGMDIQGKYGGSKGSSLRRFSQEASNSLLLKLFLDLLEYYELQFLDNDVDERKREYKKCRSILDKYKGLKCSLDIPELKKIDSEYIRNMMQRAMEEVANGQYDHALLLARTLLEEVFIHVIEKQKKVVEKKGQIMELYNRVKTLYKMHNDPKLDKRINGLLSSLNNIVSSIGEMRNDVSDAHGQGSRRKNIKDYHARLYLNSAMTIADFVLSVADNNE